VAPFVVRRRIGLTSPRASGATTQSIETVIAVPTARRDGASINPKGRPDGSGLDDAGYGDSGGLVVLTTEVGDGVVR
jgi:hypothetical protein